MERVIVDKIPVEADWGDYQSEIDAIDAYKLYAGKDAESLKSVFCEFTDRCVEGLHFMPVDVFNYYADIFAGYVEQVHTISGLSPENKEKAAAGLFTLLENKLHIMPNDLRKVLPRLISVASYVANNRDAYFMSEQEYGDLAGRVAVFKRLAKEANIIE